MAESDTSLLSPLWPGQLLHHINAHPAYLTVMEAALMAICMYALISFCITTWASNFARCLPHPFSSLMDQPLPPQRTWLGSWWGWWYSCMAEFCTWLVWLVCRKDASTTNGTERDQPSKPSVNDNLTRAFPGLDEAERQYIRGIFDKVNGLKKQGIKEQKISAAWRFLDASSMALTPVLISIMPSLKGDKYEESVQILAICLSLISTICHVLPLGRGETMLWYASRLQKICWNYWRQTGEFGLQQPKQPEDGKGDDTAAPGPTKSNLETRRKDSFATFVWRVTEIMEEGRDRGQLI